MAKSLLDSLMDGIVDSVCDADLLGRRGEKLSARRNTLSVLGPCYSFTPGSFATYRSS